MRTVRGVFMLLCLCIGLNSNAQVVYQDLERTSIYQFLDEMANQQVIELNSYSKPYSRDFIAATLSSIDTSLLNSRQKRELKFYLKDYNKELIANKNFDKRLDLFYYKDSLFQISVNPILSYSYSFNHRNSNWHRRWGGEVFGSVGEHVGYYVSLTDNAEGSISQNNRYLNSEPGDVYKGSGDYSTIRGGITYGWNWGSIGLLKDNLNWGNHNYGANILSGKAPSFTRLELKANPVRWLDFTYFHGWLPSGVRDSSQAYIAGARARKVDVSKFMAANTLTIRPVKHLHISIGNSIVYSDNLQSAFFVPFMFFKAVDHTVYAGSGNFGGANTQMFFDISSRNIKNVHLFTSVFVDEISFSRMWDKQKHSNFLSAKFGAKWSNMFNSNLALSAEYTRTNPLAYRHFVNTTTFESNVVNMGHHLRDNAHEISIGIEYRPIPRVHISGTYTAAEKGKEYPYLGSTTTTPSWGLPFIDAIQWKQMRLAFHVSYQVVNDVSIYAQYQYNESSGNQLVNYTNPMFHGATNTITLGTSIGL